VNKNVDNNTGRRLVDRLDPILWMKRFLVSNKKEEQWVWPAGASAGEFEIPKSCGAGFTAHEEKRVTKHGGEQPVALSSAYSWGFQ